MFASEVVMSDLTAKEVMNQSVLCIRVDWTVEELADFLNEHSITGGPVVDEKGAVVGVVSTTDIVRNSKFALKVKAADDTPAYYQDDSDTVFLDQLIPSLAVSKDSTVTVRDIMTPMLFNVTEETPIRHVADAMLKGHIHRVFVTNEEKLLGIITTMDLLEIIRNQ